MKVLAVTGWVAALAAVAAVALLALDRRRQPPPPQAVPLSAIPQATDKFAHLSGIKRVTVSAMVVGLADVTPEDLRRRTADILNRAGVDLVEGGGADASFAVVVRANPSDAAPGLYTGNADTAVYREVIVAGGQGPVRCNVPVAALNDGGAGKLDGMGAVLAKAVEDQVAKLAGKMTGAGR